MVEWPTPQWPQGERLAGAAVLVVGPRSGPFHARVNAHILPAVKNELGAIPPEVWLEPDDLRFDDSTRLGALLRAFHSTPVAIIDAEGERGLYLLGLRDAMSWGVTLACATKPAPNWLLEGHPTNFFLLDADATLNPKDQERLRGALEGLGDLRTQGWYNFVRRSGVLNVTLSEEPLPSSFREDSWGLSEAVPQMWRHANVPATRIGLIEGPIRSVRGVDVWVNSENTLMQMARPWDRSTSAQIRGLGARPIGGVDSDRNDDAMGVALAQAMGTRRELDIGAVVITPAPDNTPLSRQHRIRGDVAVPGNEVRFVAHVATVKPRRNGEPGFESGGAIGPCVLNVMRETRSFLDRSKATANTPPVKSILFPLLGSGDGGAAVELVAAQIVANLTEHLAKTPRSFAEVYLLAYRPRDRAACLRALEANGWSLQGRAETSAAGAP